MSPSSHRARRHFRPLTLEPIESRRMLALGVEMVADVNATEYSPGTFPFGITEVNGVAYYAGGSPAAGNELWRTDGTAEGTALVKDIVPGYVSSHPYNFTNVDGTLFFTRRGNTALELWRSDGTWAGTQLVRDIVPGTEGSSIGRIAHSNGTAYFVAYDGDETTELWKSDGTAGGTFKVASSSGGLSAGIGGLATANGMVFYKANGSQLWRTDGSAAGTLQIAENLTYDSGRTEVGGLVYFSQYDEEHGDELWKTDGTIEGTQQIEVTPGPVGLKPRGLTNVGGTLFFSATEGLHRGLWRSDGTPEGTLQISDADAGTGGHLPERLYNANGTLYFVPSDGDELWKSNGTPEGTQLVADSASLGVPFSQATRFAHVGQTLYFSAASSNGIELWKSDGTLAGTAEVEDTFPGTYETQNPNVLPVNSGNPQFLTALADRLVFSAHDEDGESHLWASDGTAAGTLPLDQRLTWTRSGKVEPQLNLNGKLLFTAQDADGWAAWTSDGTATGVQRLATTGEAQDFVNVDGVAYFAAKQDALSGTELWRTNGTKFGTRLVADINPLQTNGIAAGSSPSGFVGLNGKVLFAADDGSQGRELWITDGTEAGTALLKDVADGAGSSNPMQLVRLGNFVYFTANDGSGIELWRSDGTTAGTALVKNISSKSGNPGPLDLFVFQGRLYFSADDGANGRELWQSDGTSEGTALLADLEPGLAGSRPDDFTLFGGKLLFTTTDAASNETLWQTDGTVAGTLPVVEVGVAGQFTNANGSLYFSRNRGSAGFELWKSDGTAAGTALVKALPFGPNGTDPNHLQEANGLLFFQTKIPGKAVLWVSDGTAEGTAPINTDGSGLLNRQLLTNVSGTLLFAGSDAVHGQELWKLTAANPQVQFSGTLNFTENDPLKLIAPAGSITDADDADFSAGRLSVVVQQAASGDRLQVRNQGSGSGQIGVSGREVRFGGVLIGLLRAGLPASQLIVDLNANASVAATQALLRNLGFRAVGDNPVAGQRLVAVRLTDGSGGISRTVTKSVMVQALNDAPRLVLGGQTAYQNDSAGVLLAPSATVSDPDSVNFAGALLSIEITTARGASNRLQLGGGYSIDSDRLLRNGVVVGTVLENGFGWNDLRLRFNSQMNAARVQELVRSLRFRTVDNTNLDPRTISFRLTDGDGGVSATQTKTVNLTT